MEKDLAKKFRPLEEINNLDELEYYIDCKEKELQEAIRVREVVESEAYNLKKEIIDLKIEVQNKEKERIELSKGLSKSRANCMTLALEIKRASQKYWSIKPR